MRSRTCLLECWQTSRNNYKEVQRLQMSDTFTSPPPNPGQLVPGGGGPDPKQKRFEGGEGGLQLKPFTFYITMPPPDDYYFVRKDQLDGLTQTSKDYSFEIALATGGAAAGFAQNLIEVIKNFFEAKVPTGTDLILAILALVFGVLAITKFVQFRSGENSVDRLKTKITSGQKVIVSNEGTNRQAV